MEESQFWLESEKSQGVSDKELIQWEKSHGFKLPETFKRLWQQQDGGYVNPCTSSKGGGLDQANTLKQITTLAKSKNWAKWSARSRELEDEVNEDEDFAAQLAEEMKEDGVIPIGNEALMVSFRDNGHTWLCLDWNCVGQQGEPQVTHIDFESGYFGKRIIAESFAEYIAQLKFTPSRQRPR